MAISSVSVDFIANTAKYASGLDNMSKKTKAWSDNTKKQTQGATDAFEGASKALTRFATQIISIAAIQKIGAAFVNAAKAVSDLADEAEKVGASAAQFDKLRLAAERNGSEIGDVKIAYKELQKSINEALGGTKTSIEAFRSLGLSYVALSSQTPDEQFLRIADALSKVDDQNERTRLGLLLLGKAYTELSPLIAKGAAGIETGGRGSLSNNQIQTIDKVTKSFEEVSRVLDGELKKALVALAPALTVVAKALTLIIENFKTIAVVFGLAFAPFALLKFQKLLISVSGTLLAFIIESRNAANAAKFLGGIDIIKPPSKLTLDGLSSFRLLLIQIAAGLGTISRYFLPVIAYVGATTLQVFDLTEVFFKFLSAATSKGLPQLKKTFNDIAKSVADLKSQLLDFVLPDFLRPDKKPFIGPQPLIGPFISPVDAERAGQAYEQGKVDLDKMREIRTLFLKEADDFNKKSSEFGTALGKSMMSPLEELTSALDELDNAFLFGGLEIETYTRRLDELRNTYKRVYTDVVGLTKAPGILEATRGLPDPNSIIQADLIPRKTKREKVSPLGNLSLLGMPKTPYNTAGEKVFLDLAIQSKFATADLTKSTLDLQAARERVTKMAPELYDVTRTETELLQTRLDYIKSAISVTDEYGNKIINATVASRALAQAQADLFAVVTPYFREAVQFTQNFADGLANAIVAGQGFGEALKNVFQNILKEITVLILRTTILQAIMASIGIISPDSGAAAAFGKMTGLTGRANGGPVMAGGGYRVGERGPEKFIPQTNGYILPNDMAAGETTNVYQTINVQTGVAQTVRAEMASLMPRFKADAMAGVLEAKQRGGSYSRGLSVA